MKEAVEDNGTILNYAIRHLSPFLSHLGQARRGNLTRLEKWIELFGSQDVLPQRSHKLVLIRIYQDKENLTNQLRLRHCGP
jgi:hypothetical protein